VRDSLGAIDAAMKGPSTEERGKRIAAVMNVLERALDHAEHFGVELPPTGIPPRRRAAERSSPTVDATPTVVPKTQFSNVGGRDTA
jgi:hypothetical protein